MTWEPGDELDQTLPDDQEDFVSDLGEYLREDREWINYISQYLGNLEVSLEDLLDDWISENLSTEVLNSIIANSSTVISLVIESGDFEEAVLALIEPSTGDMAKSVYDPNLIESDAFDMDSMVEGTDTKILTGAERIAITDSASHIIDTLTNPHSITAATVGLDQLTNDAQLKASQLVQTVADEIAEIPSGAAIIDYVTGLGYSGAFDRANHTGTQAASTISDFDTEVSNNTDVSSNTSSRHDAVTVTNSSEINFTLTGQNITASLITGSIDETKLDTSVNDSLNLADSALQSIADESITEPKLAMNDAPSDGEVIAWNSTGSYMEWVGIGSGSGDVVGPASATGDDFAQFDGVTGKLLKDGGLSLTTTLGSPGVDTLIPSEKAVRAAISDAGGGDVSGPSSSVDDRISTFDGETGKLIQDGGKTIADVLSRTNHTGTQAASTISDFNTAVSLNSDVVANSAFTATPSTVITAGTGIDWDGNTLNVAPNDESITIVSSIGGVSDSLMSASTDVGALFVKNYYVGVDGGGGLFYWSSTTAKTSHNGGTIIDPNHSSTPGQSTWYTNTGATGYGCWIRYTTSIVEVDWFGSKGDGTTNDVYAFRAATTYAATITTKGGTVVYRKRHYINGSLELPYGVTLKGNMSLVGHPTNSQTSHYWNHLPAILLSSSYTITLNGASGIDGALIIKYGLTLPTNSPDSNYSGTAVTAVGEDNFLINSLIIGFDYAFYAQGDNTSVKVQRIRINYLWFDCINGVYIENNNDVVRVTNCHAWQFGSIGATGGIEQDKYARSGNAFHFKGRVDWGIVENCFSYGWYRTVLLESTDPFGIMSMTINNCQSDNGSNAYSGSAGFEVKGSVRDCRFVNCQSSTNAYGLLLSANGGYTPSNIEMRGCHLYSSTTYGISISAGNLSLHDCYFTGIVYAIYTTSSSSKLTVDGCNFNVSSNPAIYCSTANPYIHIYNNCYFNSLSAASYVISPSVIVSPTVTPSGTVLQPPHGVNIVKCGSGNFGTLRGGHKGRVLTIIFTGTSIVYHGTSTYSDMWLPTNVTANNTFASGDTLTLAHAGDQWYEIGRSQA